MAARSGVAATWLAKKTQFDRYRRTLEPLIVLVAADWLNVVKAHTALGDDTASEPWQLPAHRGSERCATLTDQ
jgi:hypothetical protein